jgi:hypothetical protein
MRLIVFLFIILTIMACNTLNKMYRPTEKELNNYLKIFENMTGRNVDYPVFFKFEETENAGVCTHTAWGLPLYVEINLYQWRMLSEEQRIMLLLHELGHCSLGLKHDNREFKDECPKSLMHKFLAPEICINQYKLSYYLLEYKTKIIKGE